jgi:hypothetical protein
MDLLGNYAPSKVDVAPVKKNARVKKMAEEPPTEKNEMVVEEKRVMPMGTKKMVKKVKHVEAKEPKHPEAKHEAKEHKHHEEHKHMSLHELMEKNECSPAHIKKSLADAKKECIKDMNHKLAVLKADMRMKQAENKKEHRMMMKMIKKD